VNFELMRPLSPTPKTGVNEADVEQRNYFYIES